VYLLKNSDRIGALKALAITLLLFVALGPVVQPWYLVWGLLLLAPVAIGRWRTLIIAVSVLSPFIGLPGGRTLLDQLIHSDPLSVALALVVLLGVLLVPLGRWSGSWRWRAALDGSDSWGDTLEPQLQEGLSGP
jgi:alpha-1,6-mannosyltransferase